MKYTIKDVAREAGVSIATVSRVINNKDRVKESTRKKIEQAIQKLNYQPDPIARTMIKKKTRSIGLFVPTLSNEYWALLAEVIQEELWDHGYTLMLCAGDRHSPNRVWSYFETFIDRKMDGIIVGPLQGLRNSNLISFEEILKYGIPVVSYEQSIPGAHMVAGDNLQGSIMAVEHLISLGHRQIAYIHGAAVVRDERELGYINAHILHGIPVDENLTRRVEFGIDAGYQAAKDLIGSGQKFTGLFCWNDLIAFGAIRALQDNGIRVPEDVAVVGFDNISMAKAYNPSLTTVAQPIREMGASVVKLMLESIEKNHPHDIQKSVKLSMELVVRESCGANR